MGEPKIVNHKYKEVSVPKSPMFPFGGKKQIYDVEIERPFSGSSELFNYKPNGFSFSGDPFVYCPDDSDGVIDVKVEVVNLEDRAGIIAGCKKQFELTDMFIARNNQTAESWNTMIEPQLESKLLSQKTTLEKLYS